MVHLLQQQRRAVETTTRQQVTRWATRHNTCFLMKLTSEGVVFPFLLFQQVTPVGFQNAGGAGSGNVLDLVCSGLPTKGDLVWLQRVIDLELTGSHHGCRS